MSVPGTLTARGDRAVLQTYGPRPLELVRGRGTSVFDSSGREYLDLVAGIAVVALGHGHPAPLAALAAQWDRLGHVSNLHWTAPGVALAERLTSLSGLDRVFFCNSGAEANEAAIKLARRVGRARGGADKYEIVCVEGAFHGRTLGALSATWAPAKRAPFEPLLPGFVHVRANDIEALRAAVTPRTAAVLAEPILGEGGVWPLDAAFLQAAREACDRNAALLMLDEVQTGVGRCGAWFRFQDLPVTPDAVCLAKGLGSGLPIGALLAREVEGGLRPGDHGTTFGGSPPIAAGALAVLDVIERDGLVENARQVGALLAEGLARIDGVRAVRGAGLMLAVELETDSSAVAEYLRERESIIVNAVTPTAIRLTPPLILTSSEAERAISAFGRAISP